MGWMDTWEALSRGWALVPKTAWGFRFQKRSDVMRTEFSSSAWPSFLPCRSVGWGLDPRGQLLLSWACGEGKPWRLGLAPARLVLLCLSAIKGSVAFANRLRAGKTGFPRSHGSCSGLGILFGSVPSPSTVFVPFYLFTNIYIKIFFSFSVKK